MHKESGRIAMHKSDRPAIWGGVECTVNRVGDRYFDQLARSRHRDRLTDLDRFAHLGIRTLRVPLLWEHLQPEASSEPDWRWSDRAMQRLRDLGVRPVVGLLHHGFGPRWVDIHDPEFAVHFARFARKVAERYPWVDAYTPVNEPLTTARFSGLYGHWYPHGRSDADFTRVLLAQLSSTSRAMREIRHVNSGAELIQTEDLGRVESTARLSYQRNFENHRRWLTWDILCGMLSAGHACWEYLLRSGCTERELMRFADEPCPPDIIGVNHYVTSDRYLDHRIDRYAQFEIGGNGRDSYADVAQASAIPDRRCGLQPLLAEAWARYAVPLAVTECHLGCTREEQMRWLGEVWQAATQLHRDGADVRAVTTWALLGSYDWNTLVTRETDYYESGAFDIRAPEPRPTAVARMVRSLAEVGDCEHPVLRSPGWWRRTEEPSRKAATHARRSPQPILITGATGTLGRAIADACERRGLEHRLAGRHELDIAVRSSVRHALARYSPWAVINAAGYVDVERAEEEPDRCLRENVDGAVALAAECAEWGVRFVTYSSDLVFGGEKGGSYVESDSVSPLNTYGASKAEAERAVLAIMRDSLVIRTAAFFSHVDSHNLVTRALRSLCADEQVIVPYDCVVTPTYVPHLAHSTLDLLLDQEDGIWHLSSGRAVTWHELITEAASRLSVPTDRLFQAAASELYRARRPQQSALSSERGWPMPTLDSALDGYCDHLRPRLSQFAGRLCTDAF